MAYKPFATRHFEVLSAIRSFKKEQGRYPSLQELWKATDISTSAQVCNALRRLEDEGFLQRRTALSRAIKLSYRGETVDLNMLMNGDHCKNDSDMTRAKKAEGGRKARALQGDVLDKNKRSARREREQTLIDRVVAKALKREQEGIVALQTLDPVRDYPHGSFKVIRLG